MNGILIINKESGWTSNDVVQKVKHIVKEKVGHTGTLDPMATGVLPLLIGKGTELSKYLINHDKEYEVTLKLGIKTSTADSEGEVLEQKNVKKENLFEKNVKRVLDSFIGKNIQTPPIYSAIKVKGKKLYEYARSGKSVDIPARDIEIYDLKLLNIDIENKLLTYEIYCSKGTYVRTMCEKIAEALDTVGYMKELQRTMVGNFKIEDSVTIEELKENFDKKDFLNQKIISLESFFSKKDKVILGNKQLSLLLNGVLIGANYSDDIFRIYNENGIFIGIAVATNGKLKRKIIVEQ